MIGQRNNKKNVKTPKTLLQLMIAHFSLKELDDLCFELNVNFENLAGNNLEQIITDLILHMYRHSRLEELRQVLARERKFVTWPSLLFIQFEARYLAYPKKIKAVAIASGILILLFILFAPYIQSEEGNINFITQITVWINQDSPNQETETESESNDTFPIADDSIQIAFATLTPLPAIENPEETSVLPSQTNIDVTIVATEISAEQVNVQVTETPNPTSLPEQETTPVSSTASPTSLQATSTLNIATTEPASSATPSSLQTATVTPTFTHTPRLTSTPSSTPSPTETPTPTASPTQTSTSMPTPTATFTPTEVPTQVPTPTQTPTSAPPESSGEISKIYISPNNGGVIDSVSFKKEDILIFDLDSETWELHFDGSDVGLIGTDVNAFTILADGSILMSLDTGDFDVPDVGPVKGNDILQFTPTLLGESTEGVFSMYFDGSDVGLETFDENIVAIDIVQDDWLAISVLRNFDVPNINGEDEDIIVFIPDSFGWETTGNWSFYFDGSDVDLIETSEEIGGLWINNSEDGVYLATSGDFSVGMISGDGSDIFICLPISLAEDTNCDFGDELFWLGANYGFGGENIDGLYIE